MKKAKYTGCAIIDTFPDFVSCWNKIKNDSVEQQITCWESKYMKKWPELLKKQKESWNSDKEDWKQIAAEKVFPFFNERFSAMEAAHLNLLKSCKTVWPKAQKTLEFSDNVCFVIYVGIGCGAGWASSYNGSPAVLFGLEMIAECGWGQEPALSGLIAHELGHIAQTASIVNQQRSSGAWWHLFKEGFAARSAHCIIGYDVWHEATGINKPDWLNWCNSHKGWLASEFIKKADAGEDIRSFFGSWFDIMGRKQCGYFLGHEIIRELQKEYSLKEISSFDDYEEKCRAILEQYVEVAESKEF